MIDTIRNLLDEADETVETLLYIVFCSFLDSVDCAFVVDVIALVVVGEGDKK